MLSIRNWTFRQIDVRNGVWALRYTRGDTNCVRRITDAQGRPIHYTARKPIGQELVDTVEEIIGRKLMLSESEILLTETPMAK